MKNNNDAPFDNVELVLLVILTLVILHDTYYSI